MNDSRSAVTVLQAKNPRKRKLLNDLNRLYKGAFFRILYGRNMSPAMRDFFADMIVSSARMLFGSRWSIIAGASKGNTFENDLLKLIFNATAIANIADNAATSPLTNLYASLHTGDPGEGGDQTTNEISYTPYARIAVARTTGGFTVTGASVSPVAAITFAQMTSGAGGTASYGVIGTSSSGAGKILYSGALSPTIAVANGVTPIIDVTSTVTED